MERLFNKIQNIDETYLLDIPEFPWTNVFPPKREHLSMNSLTFTRYKQMFFKMIGNMKDSSTVFLTKVRH